MSEIPGNIDWSLTSWEGTLIERYSTFSKSMRSLTGKPCR